MVHIAIFIVMLHIFKNSRGNGGSDHYPHQNYMLIIHYVWTQLLNYTFHTLRNIFLLYTVSLNKFLCTSQLYVIKLNFTQRNVSLLNVSWIDQVIEMKRYSTIIDNSSFLSQQCPKRYEIFFIMNVLTHFYLHLPSMCGNECLRSLQSSSGQFTTEKFCNSYHCGVVSNRNGKYFCR